MKNILTRFGDYKQKIVASFERGKQFISHDVWHLGAPGEPIPNGFITKHVRALILVTRGITDETLLLRAAALTFATMLFLVPFLVFLFYFITTFQLGDRMYSSISDALNTRIESLLEERRIPFLSPPEHTETEMESIPEYDGDSFLNDEDDEEVDYEDTTLSESEYSERLIDQLMVTVFPIFTDESGLADRGDFEDPIKMLVDLAQRGATNPQTLGLTGVLFILSTVFGFMRNVESSFNGIWGVKQGRNYFKSLKTYFLITILMPFAVAGYTGMAAALASDYMATTLGPLAIAIRWFQIIIVCLTFSLLYYFVPNTKVYFKYALYGGMVAGVFWGITAWAYVRFQFGMANYTPFFSGFALFPLFMMWIYVSWMILLFGALLTYAYQNEKTFAMERLAEGASIAYREALGLRTMIELARRFRQGTPGLTTAQMAELWNVPTRLLNDTLEYLTQAGMVTPCATEPIRYQPAQSPENIRVSDVLNALRESGKDPSLLREEPHYRELFKDVTIYDTATLSKNIARLAEELPALNEENTTE